MVKKKKKTKGHCWHPEGPEQTYSDGERGTTVDKCCFCGTAQVRHWRLRVRRHPSHGEHHPGIRERVYQPDTAPCPVRDA